MIARNPYPSDLTDAQWQRLAPRIPPAEPGGRPREHDTRELCNAIVSVTRAGGDWRMLPHAFPPWPTVYPPSGAGSATGRRGSLAVSRRGVMEPGAPSWAGFGWLGRCRRRSKEYEALPERSEAFVRIAMIPRLLRRLSRTNPSYTGSNRRHSPHLRGGLRFA